MRRSPRGPSRGRRVLAFALKGASDRLSNRIPRLAPDPALLRAGSAAHRFSSKSHCDFPRPDSAHERTAHQQLGFPTAAVSFLSAQRAVARASANRRAPEFSLQSSPRRRGARSKLCVRFRIANWHKLSLFAPDRAAQKARRPEPRAAASALRAEPSSRFTDLSSVLRVACRFSCSSQPRRSGPCCLSSDYLRSRTRSVSRPGRRARWP
mmetsp:Transcript_23657/g.80659  ORF Transcript_23657/g.80659 Transcript_23657/m.80659 type:complete len:209 (+) Transcript_23657:4772-5398(+)